MKYRSIFISDVHLGSTSCKAAFLVDFLRHNESDTLYLVGDILDGWKVAQNKFNWHPDQSKVVEKIFRKARKENTKVLYIVGNHDEFIRPMLKHNLKFDSIEFHNLYDHIGVDGKKYVVVHGDLFDGIEAVAPWLSHLGDAIYSWLLTLNTLVNRVRRLFGFNYWSLSKYLKMQAKSAVDFIFKFEENLADYARKKGYDGVICGHIHHAEIRDIGGIRYLNSGDWQESCSALVEHYDGTFEIIYWTAIKQ